jgi:hypothetical protein
MSTRRFYDGAQTEIGSLPVSAIAAAQTVVLSAIAATTTVYNPTVVRQANNAINLNIIAATTAVYNPVVVQGGGVQTITLNSIAATTTVYNPTVIQAGGVQTVILNAIAPITQVYNPTITLVSLVTDTSDILDRGLRRLRKEEEEVAAQILKSRRPKQPEPAKRQTDWKELLLRQINGAETIEALDSIEIPIESTEITAKVLAVVERRKEARRLEIQIAQKEAEVKILELQAEAEAKEAQYVKGLQERQQEIAAAKQLQQEVLARYEIAVQKALEEEKQSYLEAYRAEQEATEFTRKRNNRIKRLRALMWLAKLDL